MTVSRRNFLRKSSMIALAATLPLSLSTLGSGQQQGGPPPGVPPAAQRNPLYNFTRSTFASYVNSVFIVNSVPLAEIVLVEVKETPLVVDRMANRTPVGECFTLVFRGPAQTRFKQNTYRLEHASLGQFELFLGPTDRPDNEHQYYTAVINRRL
ncbi:MAG: hypothetical protein QOF02_3750 [Blastocatellia bacterium]|jgi:hypothetical protein|nr:hypothetical protein [Blastocatellia bacterium]